MDDALSKLHARIDTFAGALIGAQIEGQLHQMLVEDALGHVGYTILANPVGVPDVYAELR